MADERTEREYLQRTGVLHPDAMRRMQDARLAALRQFNREAANRDPRTDPTLRDSIYLPQQEDTVPTNALKGAHLAREALGGHMALEDYETGLQKALTQLRAYADRYGLEWPHSIECDLDEDCTCSASDEQIERSFDAYR